VEIRLENDPDGDATAAARLAAERAGVAAETGGAPGLWWRAGLADAVERAPEPRAAAAPGYEAAPSPRSTRGATRA
jgi:hypothetical protein